MARVNWTQVEREERALEEACERGEITPKELARELRDMQRDLQDDYREQQRSDERDEFGW